MSLKSLFCKILPLSLTRSRFCEPIFKAAQWFQDFANREGGGGTPETAPLLVQLEGGSLFYKWVNICLPQRTRARIGHYPGLLLRLRVGIDAVAPCGAGSRAGRSASTTSTVGLGRNINPSPRTQLVEGFASLVLTLTCTCVFFSAVAFAQSSRRPATHHHRSHQA